MDTMPTLERQDKIEIDEAPGYQRRRRVIRDVGAQQKQTLSKISQFIWLLFSVLEMLIGLRVILKLVAADPNNVFANFIYHVTSPFLQPFFGLMPTPTAEGMVLETSSIVAMLAYALLAWFIIRLIWLIFYHPINTVVSTIEKQKMD
jgi:YggT family protein